MARGRHSRSAFGRSTLFAAVVALVLGLVGGGSAIAAYRYDRAAAVRILPGVAIAGVDVGGMTRAEAVRAVRDEAALTLGRTVVVRAADRRWSATPATLGTGADVAGAVDRAFGLAGRMSLLSRVYHRVADRPVPVSIGLRYTYDRSSVADFVAHVANAVAERASNAGLALVDGQLVMRHSSPGRELRTDAATRAITQALVHRKHTVRVPVRPVAPKVSDATLGRTIVVDISENELYLYDGFGVEKRYRVATAAEGFVTPVGTWSIVNKVENPSWTNPDPTGWGAGMPAYIPPGPDNPLGTRALYLNAPGIRIHGTTNVESIGTYASHGCIRMLMPDVEELYPLVPIGTTVIVKP
jgi:lipoprotein-anchoring transpeptidase ErfK/SrfK